MPFRMFISLSGNLRDQVAKTCSARVRVGSNDDKQARKSDQILVQQSLQEHQPQQQNQWRQIDTTKIRQEPSDGR